MELEPQWQMIKPGSNAGGARAVATPASLNALKRLNDDYLKRHGFIFIVFATGKSAAEMLELAEERIKNPKRVEIENAAAEQAKITRLRLERWISGKQ